MRVPDAVDAPETPEPVIPPPDWVLPWVPTFPPGDPDPQPPSS